MEIRAKRCGNLKSLGEDTVTGSAATKRHVGAVRRLNSDQLGAKGEFHFQQMCADARLTCNRATRDRTGWDFLIEFEFENDDEQSLDARKPPLSCYVQVKTIWENNTSVKLRLNMAERLAKEMKPAFVCVLVVNDNLDFVDAFLIHIAGARLANILKRLREESARPDPKAPNRIFIGMTPLPDEQIVASGSSLQSAIHRHAGGDSYQYIIRKKKDRDEIGYGEKPFQIFMSFEGITGDELGDVMLGLVKNVDVAAIESSVTRFGITLSDGPPMPAKVTVQPQSGVRCAITFRSSDEDEPAVFDCDIFRTIPINGTTRTLIRHAFFDMQFFERADSEARMKIDFLVFEKSFTPARWAEFFQFAIVLAAEKCEINLTSSPWAKVKPIPIQSEYANRDGYRQSQCQRRQACVSLSRILRHAGVALEPLLLWDDIEPALEQITLFASLLSGKDAELEFNAENVAQQIPGQEFILAAAFPLGQAVIAYHGIVAPRAADALPPTVSEKRKYAFKRVRLLADESHKESFGLDASHDEDIEQVIWA